MRYELKEWPARWDVFDTKEQLGLLSISKRFPDAEFMARTQCAFLNESPAMQSS